MPQPSTTGPADTTSTDPDLQEQQEPTITEGTDGTEAPDGEDGADGATPEDKTSDSKVEEADEDALPDPIKAILKKNRDAAKEAEGAKKAEARRAKELEQQLARYKDKHGELPDEAPDPVAEALAKANQRILKAEVRAAAKGKFRDVSDAFANLDLSEFDVSDDGEVDSEAIEAALDDILSRKAYLGADEAPKPKRFEGSADQGTTSGSADRQWTKADLEKATPQQIVAADSKGLLANLKKGL